MTYVTATSGGYGKCVPSTRISKSIDMCLMMTGMILICINSINIIKYNNIIKIILHLQNENIAVLKNSHESFFEIIM